ncbi:MAG: hypothetical protein HYZ74_00365 [Elusimicrobia bacterium]|nr:hypothetical protein [Elusimicrobiota bacterium]
MNWRIVALLAALAAGAWAADDRALPRGSAASESLGAAPVEPEPRFHYDMGPAEVDVS